MKTLAKYYVCNRCVIGEKTFKNILIGKDYTDTGCCEYRIWDFEH